MPSIALAGGRPAIAPRFRTGVDVVNAVIRGRKGAPVDLCAVPNRTNGGRRINAVNLATNGNGRLRVRRAADHIVAGIRFRLLPAKERRIHGGRAGVAEMAGPGHREVAGRVRVQGFREGSRYRWGLRIIRIAGRDDGREGRSAT